MQVTSNEVVKAKVEAAAVASQQEVCTALNLHYQDDLASTYAKAFVGASDVKWDQQRQMMSKHYDATTKTQRALTLHDLNPKLSAEVKAPTFRSAHTCARERKKISKELGLEVLEEDGSAVQVQLLRSAIKAALLRKGLKRSSKEVNEMIVGGDAVGVFNRGKHKMTYVSLKSTGSFPLHNSPRGLFSLLQWQGGDDFAPLQRQCTGVIIEMKNQIKDGGMLVTPPCSDGSYSDDSDDSDDGYDSDDALNGDKQFIKHSRYRRKRKIFCKTKMILSADGAMIVSQEGGTGFCGAFPCPWCMAPKDQLGAEKEYPKKTHKYLCNASHMPSDLGPEDAFPFTCPVCASTFNDQAAVDNEEEFEGSARLTFQRAHDQVHKHPCLFPLEPIDINACTLHCLMGSQKHTWRHGISDNIAGQGKVGEAKAKLVMEKLLKKCGVVMDITKVAKGVHAKAVKLVSLGGEQARAVCSHFELFLKICYGFDEDYDRAHPPAGTKPYEARQFSQAAYVGDCLLELWNVIASRMHDRTDANGNRLPATNDEVLAKAEELRLSAKKYRAAYRMAWGNEAFKPYTHITRHLHEFQRRLQYDLKDYSTEAQEHQGKVMKGHTKKNSNGRLSKADKNGKKAASYVQQASEQHQCKLAAEQAHPYLIDQKHHRMKKRNKEEIQKRIVKSEVWCEDVCDQALSQKFEDGGGEQQLVCR